MTKSSDIGISSSILSILLSFYVKRSKILNIVTNWRHLETKKFIKVYWLGIKDEEIPQDEIHVDQNNRASYSSISFHKGSDGILFKFVIKNSETLANTKVCLRHRLGMSEKDFSKVKIAIVSETSYANPEYLDDDEMTLSNEGCLGLDHVDKSGCAESVFIRG
ncbi:hypothetical protein GLOIN_2v1841540 [Rhizophagus irregularis DAOM 181602=DAOM 197198]|uniref:ubiquitinyl hydrolase 1 n=1 Tax=Rhizophagus irregularis (strain DAOM 181602 / DAOM 197198 / MUCL 43194) TaxID=747089 RepID=A0A2P4PZ70_RHIID|nr:hypothetical protein GLOIN_2v1841540 [Rhizophagus irregularis DAOM 181602=DAOM 197198]PKY27610.1 hypothetical protein RhiirB3_478867 [Rhizophagus irregularis]POG70673.1 hypothetical protein GLOIN_2v1841540 [Rhizophagus irregularis DAOM 181602=DAOM 197198]|eukprot:XP_025177539.1 hypothetical protein GLOIN_2v1841540 [Rhizophagus irregularis DAOM 181602=DAOM 197198]